MDDKKPAPRDRVYGLIGAVVMACVVVGTVGIVAAIFAAGKSDWTGVGVCLLASSIAFGALFNGMTR